MVIQGERNQLLTDNERPNTHGYGWEIKKLLLGCSIGFLLCLIVVYAALFTIHLLYYENIDEKPCEKRILGTYRLFESRDVSVEQFSKLTHLLITSLLYQKNGTIAFAGNRENFERISKRAKAFKVKVMFTLEIKGIEETDLELVRMDLKKREILVNSIVSFIREHQLDGVNIHWQHPNTKEKKLFVLELCKDIRQKLSKLQEFTKRKDQYLLSLVFERHKIQMDFDELFKYVDFLNVETDNYYGNWHRSNWNELIGPTTPLYSGHGKNSKHNLDATMRYYSCLTGKPHLLNIMVAFSGRFWKNVIPPKDPSQTLWMKAEPINGIVEGGFEHFRDHEKNGWDGPNVSWNNESKTPYIWNPANRTYQAFENVRSFQEKVKYAEAKKIGGFLVWSINEDDEKDTLLSVLADANLCSQKNNKEVVYNCDGVL